MYAPGYPPPMGAPMPGYGPQPVVREKARGYGIDPVESMCNGSISTRS